MISREKTLNRIKETGKFDMIVIGGGASGIGAAVEGALRGYKTLLLEKHDFTKGTSSKSTKLVHGGVRYMAQGDLKMVREALKERGHLVKNAPHLVHAQPFIIPIYRWWQAAFYTIGLTFYDLLAGRYSLGRSTFLGKSKTLRELPGISPEKLKGGVRYYDGQFDDSRLAIDLLHVLSEHGGMTLNYAEVTGITKDEAGRTNGVVFIDGAAMLPTEITAEASAVINATGVWVDKVMEMDTPGHRKTIRPSQGIHLVLPKAFLPGSHALMIPKTSDGRVLFAVPWHDHLVVGTTDTPVDEPSAEPVPLDEEVEFILQTATAYLERPVERKDVLAIFAGLRPLAAPKDGDSKTREISRNHKILVSDSKLITIIGGKWTTYRKMAQDLVDTAIRQQMLVPSVSNTKHYHLYEPGNESGPAESSAGEPESEHPGRSSKAVSTQAGSESTQTETDRLKLYGQHRAPIELLIEQDADLAESIHPELPYTYAEAIWCAKHEMVVHLEDLLARRLRALLLNAAATSDAAEKVAEKIAPVVGWTPAETSAEVSEFRKLAKSYIL